LHIGPRELERLSVEEFESACDYIDELSNRAKDA
jgi:hypothetical protein